MTDSSRRGHGPEPRCPRCGAFGQFRAIRLATMDRGGTAGNHGLMQTIIDTEATSDEEMVVAVTDVRPVTSPELRLTCRKPSNCH